MKTYKNLYPQICAFDNLYQAHRQARRGGKRKQPEVAEFEHNLGENLLALQTELLAQTYTPGPYRNFIVIERKERKISAAPYRDRVVHHALINVIGPIFEARFIHDTYANRVGKGTHAALDRAQFFARRYPYALKCDVREFFPSIDHAILRDLLAHHIACLRTLWLIDRILTSGEGILTDRYTMQWFPGDDLFAVHRPRGLPIGNLTSQHWANLYLHPLDMFVKHELHCKAYVRYSDDSVLFAADKSTLHQWRQAIIERLQTLRLTIHEEQAQVFPVKNGIDFLGWRVFPHYRRLRRENLRFAIRRLRQQQTAVARGQLSFADLSASVQAWLAHAAHGNTYQVRRRVLRRFVFQRISSPRRPSRKAQRAG
ncbi:MAG TPA: reverse transcriptase domain-containing protein [Anaerolineae bacterium]|nr:reverse transcriptase domain-containing protein [Anaerolineae bacterium]HQH40039.1 reverse transcriptase domain-containing protein [Anaerolineae bacterium]